MKVAINSALWGCYASHFGLKKDWKVFVREAAKTGYAGVELGGSEATLGKPSECRAFVEDQGLEISSFFLNVTYNPWRPNTLEYRQSIRYAARLGVKTNRVPTISAIAKIAPIAICVNRLLIEPPPGKMSGCC